MGKSVRIKDKNNPLETAGNSVPKAFENIAKGSELTRKLQELIKQVFITDLENNMIIELDWPILNEGISPVISF